MKKQILVIWAILFGFMPSIAQNAPGCNAQFTFSVTGNVVNFVSLPSSSATAHSWSFGDGNASTVANPTNTYFFCGTYLVRHVVISGNCVDSSVMTVVINQNCSQNCTLVANFTATNTASPNTFTFTNTSTGFAPGDSIRWTFGDGSTSTDANPTHTYANAGTYTVCLRVKKGNWPATAPPCVRDVCQVVTVATPVSCNIQAAFSVQPTTTTPNTYLFTNTSVNLQPGDSVFWNFGDGTSSMQTNPVHTYANAGTYIACIRIKRMMPAGTPACIREACQTIVVAQPTPCSFAPTFTYTSNPNNVFVFINTTANSSATALVQWNFGDNTTGTGQIVTHAYTQPGTYLVCLRITISNTCVRDTCMTVVVSPVTPTPCTLQASYTYTNNGYVYSFLNTTSGYVPGDTIRWTFSSGTVTNVSNPSVTFPGPGTYTVCLRIKKPTISGSVPCVSEICQNIVVQSVPSPCSIPMTITAQPAPNAANVVLFTYQSSTTNAPLVTWNFGDSLTGTGTVVTHTYAQAGTYTVCVRVAVSNTCFRDSCFQVVVNGTTPTPCNLQAAYTFTNSGYTYTFTNTTLGYTAGDTIRWTFSNGNITNVQNPVINFPAAGTYWVCLRVKKPTPPGGVPCVSERCDSITVAQVPCTFTPTFTYSQTSSNLYAFTNTTANMPPGNVYVQWNFGDGSTGMGNAASHVYTQPGTYTVCMRIWLDSTCVRDVCQSITVGSTPCTLQPWFIYSQSSNTAPYVVQFTNQSTPVNTQASVTWNFGDGTAGSGYGITHTYTQPGTYTVCMTLTTGLNCVRDTCRTIVVGTTPTPCNLPMTISVQPAPNAPNVIAFTYQSPTTNAPQVVWNFGDSTTGSGPVVTHSYAQSGIYNVCVRVTVSNTCFRDSCFTVTVGGTTPPSPTICNSIQTSFTYTQDVYMPNKLYFITVSNYPVASETWTITPLNNNGSVVTLNQYNPAYLFGQLGSYRVCLRAVIQNGCIKEYCDTVSITSLGTQCLLSAYPNPATTQVSVTAVLSAPATIYANLYNSQNILVRQRVQAGIAGNNVVGFNISTLPAGMYTIRLYYGQQVCTARFMKY